MSYNPSKVEVPKHLLKGRLLNFCVMLEAGCYLLYAVIQNPTLFLHKEIHRPAALNSLNKSSTGLYKQPRETGKVWFFMSRYNPLTYGV